MVEQNLRKTPDWVTQADERILELLVDTDPLPASAIREKLASINSATEYSRGHISRRCSILAESGFLKKRYRNYSLSDQGYEYLSGGDTALE
jgi:hypothetical protein